MKNLIIGILCVVIGLPCTAFFVSDLAGLIMGILPICLILGGALAIYLGIEDIKAGNTIQGKTPPKAPAMTVAEPEAPANGAPAIVEEPAPPIQSNGEGPASSEPAPCTQENNAYRGNTDSLVFHKISCKFSQGKKCSALFNSPEEAIAAGYKPCKICMP